MKNEKSLRLRDLPTAEVIDDSEQMIEHGMDLIELLLELEQILEEGGPLHVSICLSKISHALNGSY